MKKITTLFLALMMGAMMFSFKADDAGELITRTGHIWFSSKTAMETIDGHNKQVASILKTKTGELVFSVIMKSFEFQKALMQEHFNEKYLETDKFPKATFKGKITNLAAINFSKDGSYKADVEGDLTIHGVTKKIIEKATFTVKGADVNAKCDIKVVLSEYNITVPRVVVDKIAKAVDVNMDMDYKPKK